MDLGENCFFFSVLAGQNWLQLDFRRRRIRFFVPAHPGVAFYPESSKPRDVKKYALLKRAFISIVTVVIRTLFYVKVKQDFAV